MKAWNFPEACRESLRNYSEQLTPQIRPAKMRNTFLAQIILLT
jgi:hypothetical protein